jgi:tetratricopeptide (TPR) repeat protein
MDLHISIIVVLISLGLLSCKQKDADTSLESKSSAEQIREDQTMTAEQLEAVGYKQYNSDHQAAINAFRKAASLYEDKNEFKSAAKMHTNVCNLYRDALDNKNAAVDSGLKAIELWRKENDLLQIANLLKDVGLMQAETFQHKKAFRSLNEAATIFYRQNNKDALAIVDHNRAVTYLLIENYKKAESSLMKAQKHWKEKSTINRIFNNNILAIKIYKASNQLDKMQAIIEECENMRTYNEINRYAEERYTELIKTL